MRAAPGFYELAKRLEKVEALDSIGAPLAKAVTKAVPGGVVKDFLSGTWLGHALHPVLTDVPIGAFVSASALDLIGGEETSKASELLLGLGLAAAVPTAVAGLTDWADTVGGERRVGVAHATSNTVALVLYGASLAARRRGRRALGVALALAGSGVTTVGAYLGGHLSLSEGVGVDQATFDEADAPQDWTPVLADAELGEGQSRKVDVDGVSVLLVRQRGRVLALSNRCSHLGGPLHEGEIRDSTVMCPWHFSTFRLEDGGVVSGPARAPQPAYETRTQDGRIEVRLQELWRS